MSDKQPGNNMRSLDRAIDVLEVLEDAPRGLRLTEIARRAGLHVATTLRILNALEARGRVERDETHYRAGVGLLFGAHAYLTTSPLVAAARPVLQDLASETGLTSSVFVRTGYSRAVIARVEGSNPLRYELPIGERLPLHLGAGKILAAHLSDADRDELLSRVAPFVTAGGREMTGEDFTAELDEIRGSGIAVSTDERIIGGRSVAAAVHDRDGAVTAAVQVAGTDESVSEDRLKALAITVRNAADQLSRRL
ncbi:IclR family transcriptional regulator [Knoellia koreensis]|uniref:IclR family transcriptional regulator n=1 Tax=Knoellia koreensis TaxID=2730921 RepID=A0A849HJD6_9MICO|nr:IclR family transcriptional regulator [Knoellia sp. DB2414S]NNM46763.1 IclR family transcriptional regulator [Knoellia sp. DB2414S]